ncbi:unannotated protein [freshwater metagenome]|uniref:Unannotated protein n=1 Tax=freshwater metagenome TaxID=449393 RepID=A0A6J7GKF2_9ZZZZ
MTSAHSTRACGKEARLKVARAAVTPSRSIASTLSPTLARASASEPIPQPRSATVAHSADRNRPACWAATLSRVACSRPACVNSMVAANAPNFFSARCLSFDWVSTVATNPGECPAFRSRETRAKTSFSEEYGGRSVKSRSASGVRSSASSVASILSTLAVNFNRNGVAQAGLPHHRIGTRFARVLGDVVNSLLALAPVGC